MITIISFINSFGLNSYKEAIQPVTTVKPAERKWRGGVRVRSVRV